MLLYAIDILFYLNYILRCHIFSQNYQIVCDLIFFYCKSCYNCLLYLNYDTELHLFSHHVTCEHFS